MRTFLPLALMMLSAFVAVATAQSLRSFVDSETPLLLDTYKDIHAHPELSHSEARTSGVLAAALRDAGFTVSERVGRYPDGHRPMVWLGNCLPIAGHSLALRLEC